MISAIVLFSATPAIAGSQLNVSDLSSNNSSITRATAIKHSDAVIVKATEGTTYTNPYFKTDIESALAQGKLIGAYHYARAERNNPKDEAWHFIHTVRGYLGRCMLALDWEGSSLNVSPVWARQWLDYVYNVTGVKPLLYTSEWYVRKMETVQKGDYGLWVAKYSANNPNVAPWYFKALWQYTSYPYDKSYFYGDKKAWQLYGKRK